MAYKVTEILDYNSLKVSPEWIWNTLSGQKIIIAGVNPPEKIDDNPIIIEKLKNIVLSKEVELLNPQSVVNDYLVSDVLVDGKSIRDLLSSA